MVLLKLLAKLLPESEHYVSVAWLKAQERQEHRVEFHSQRITWPVNKAGNERAWANRWLLRRRDVA